MIDTRCCCAQNATDQAYHATGDRKPSATEDVLETADDQKKGGLAEAVNECNPCEVSDGPKSSLVVFRSVATSAKPPVAGCKPASESCVGTHEQWADPITLGYATAMPDRKTRRNRALY